jgi:hypothetical protein
MMRVQLYILEVCYKAVEKWASIDQGSVEMGKVKWDLGIKDGV